MDPVAFEHHLTSPQGRGRLPAGATTATVDGGACCDRIRFSIAVSEDLVADAGFEARGCGAASAAASAAVALVRGRTVLEAAAVGAGEITAELGGLSPVKLHAAQLAADALARALGGAAARAAAVPCTPGGRTLVALSGGVDSAVAGLLAAQRGAAVAVTLELWSDREHDGERSCCSASAVAQARALAHSMSLAHLTLDLRAQFRTGVVEPFIASFTAGETPNPCVSCNGHVRLDAMLALAARLGCDRLATGHYARLAEEGDPGGPLLRAAVDAGKDQTYMLAALSGASLARMRFPLGDLTKPEVRGIAARAGLPVAAKPESQDLCFLAGTDRGRFLARHGKLGERPGAIVDQRGNVLGVHRGQHLFTVGQRRGIGISARSPLYVLDKDAGANTLLVGPRAARRTAQVGVRDAQLRRAGERVNAVKLRYRSQALGARVLGDPPAGRHAALTIELEHPVDGVAPGQLACLMDGELVVGWATIARR